MLSKSCYLRNSEGHTGRERCKWNGTRKEGDRLFPRPDTTVSDQGSIKTSFYLHLFSIWWGQHLLPKGKNRCRNLTQMRFGSKLSNSLWPSISLCDLKVNLINRVNSQKSCSRRPTVWVYISVHNSNNCFSVSSIYSKWIRTEFKFYIKMVSIYKKGNIYFHSQILKEDLAIAVQWIVELTYHA